MSRKHYIAAAAAIREAWESESDNYRAQLAVERVAFGLADTFQSDNPAFDRARFMRAAIPEPQPVPATHDDQLTALEQFNG
jgi:hypothetical protein